MATIRKRDNASIFISRIKAVHCQSDFIFYADVPTFLRVFDGMMVRAATVYWQPPHRRDRVRYEPLDWGAHVESDLSGIKWWWFALPEAVFGEEPAELRWPSTPLELKVAARAHLEQLLAAARGAPARLSSRTVYTETSWFRAFNSEVAVALQVLNTPNARLCAPPTSLRLTHATMPSERRWASFKRHTKGALWDSAGMPLVDGAPLPLAEENGIGGGDSDSVPVAELARACAGAAGNAWVETTESGSSRRRGGSAPSHVPCVFVVDEPFS